jgi:hypothetical protein
VNKFKNYFEDTRNNANENFLLLAEIFHSMIMEWIALARMVITWVIPHQPLNHTLSMYKTPNTTSNISNVTIMGAYSNISASFSRFW